MAIYTDVKLMKTCKTCGLEKNINEFSKRKISKDGYRNQCRICVLNHSKNYYKNNEDKLNSSKQKNKEWREVNKEKLEEYNKIFRLTNKDKIKKYYIDNKDRINMRNKKRRDIDGKYKLKENIRQLIKNSLKNNGFRKKTKTINILGCTNDFFKSYIENQWGLPHNLNENGNIWMNWDNYGNPKDGILGPNKTWDLDHIKPLNSAKNEEDIIILNHYTNYQPLCSYENRVNKRGKYIDK